MGVLDEVQFEEQAVMQDAFFDASELQRWEHAYLDSDGDTWRIRKNYKEGRRFSGTTRSGRNTNISCRGMVRMWNLRITISNYTGD